MKEKKETTKVKKTDINFCVYSQFQSSKRKGIAKIQPVFDEIPCTARGHYEFAGAVRKKSGIRVKV